MQTRTSLTRLAWRTGLALAICIPTAVRAQTVDDREEGRGNKLALLPIVFSSPDTRLALGVLPQYLFHLGPEARPSNIRADVYYTLNRQFNVLVRPAVWTAGNRWQLGGSLRVRKWPTSFYGTGPEAREADEESFTEWLVEGSVEALRQVRRGFFVGGTYLMRWGRIRDAEPPNGLLAGLELAGAGDSRVAGAGIAASYDTREHVYLPTGGSLFRLEAQHFDRFLGGDRSFSQLTVDLRQYVNLGGSVTAGAQAIVRLSDGAVPFRMLPGVGDVVRGYSSTRFIGRHRWALQMEIRAIPVWWRLGLAVFGGVSQVSHDSGSFAGARLEAAAGLGLRFLIYPRERITVRQDFAFGRGSSGDYLDLNEAF